jgi:hypothetical protein
MEKLIKSNSVKEQRKQKEHKGKSWPEIAAHALTYRRPLATLTPNRASVRIRMNGAKEKTRGEILTETRKVIPGAYEIRQLRSGDIDAMVPDQLAKDQALNRRDTNEFKILRQDYLVEVPGVPYTLQVESGRERNNPVLIQAL